MGYNCSTPKCLYLSRLTSPISISSGNWILSVRTIFCLFMTRTAHLSRPNTILTSSEKIPMVWITKSNFLSLFAYSFKLSITKGRLNSWFRLVIYPRSVSFKVINQGIRTKTKSKGEKESLWKIPLLISTSPRLSLHAISSVIHVSLLFSNTFTMLSAIPTIFIASINQQGGTIS